MVVTNMDIIGKRAGITEENVWFAEKNIMECAMRLRHALIAEEDMLQRTRKDV